jgi:hypothetical protein
MKSIITGAMLALGVTIAGAQDVDIIVQISCCLIAGH